MPDNTLINEDDLAAAPFRPQPLPAASHAGMAGHIGLYYLPVEQLLVDPFTDGSLIIDDLKLKPKAKWLELKVTQNTIKFDENPKNNRGSTTYTTKVTATRALTGTEGAALFALEGRRCLVMLREASGRLRLVGGKESFLVVRSGSEGSNPAARAGIDLQFTGELSRPAVYYSGSFPVEGASPTLGEVGDTTSGGAGTGTVAVLNYRGELIAMVPAGRTLVLTSGFRIQVRVK